MLRVLTIMLAEEYWSGQGPPSPATSWPCGHRRGAMRFCKMELVRKVAACRRRQSLA